MICAFQTVILEIRVADIGRNVVLNVDSEQARHKRRINNPEPKIFALAFAMGFLTVSLEMMGPGYDTLHGISMPGNT